MRSGPTPLMKARELTTRAAPRAGENAMATLPGLPQTDEPEPDALPVEPDDGTTLPVLPGSPGHEPVEHPRT